MYWPFTLGTYFQIQSNPKWLKIPVARGLGKDTIARNLWEFACNEGFVGKGIAQDAGRVNPQSSIFMENQPLPLKTSSKNEHVMGIPFSPHGFSPIPRQQVLDHRLLSTFICFSPCPRKLQGLKWLGLVCLFVGWVFVALNMKGTFWPLSKDMCVIKTMGTGQLRYCPAQMLQSTWLFLLPSNF